MLNDVAPHTVSENLNLVCNVLGTEESLKISKSAVQQLQLLAENDKLEAIYNLNEDKIKLKTNTNNTKKTN